jgi:hypothetical protein
MKTISKKAKNALSDLLGDYEDLGFTLTIGTHSIELCFKGKFIHGFPPNNEMPLSGVDVQLECANYLNKFNALYN